MCSIEAELILEDWGRMGTVVAPVLHLLLNHEVVLVDVGDESRRV